MSDQSSNNSTTVKDVKQLCTFAAIGCLSYVFWICGGMEMIERLAYYGVRSLSSLYASNNIGMVWYVMGAVGIVTTFGLYVYGKWTYRFAMQLEAAAQEDA